ncbi:SDR family NAD(P)-dependent oxidoreductase [Methylolobus aquaticus]|nr:SDR family NAD(P)-dependent oxidoreductase [Methylolobus aquaticus]
MRNQVRSLRCVVTGGTAGIGLMTAKGLVSQGASVLLVGRDVERGQAACAAINEHCGEPRATFEPGDLSDLRQVRAVARAIAARWPYVDVLMNNAGAMFGTRQQTEQGLEMTFALNHLSYFTLSLLLLPMLRSAPVGARIVNVASEAHKAGRLDFEDLQSVRRYSGWRAYCASKLANLLFTQELARRLDPAAVTVNAVHPGFVATDIGIRHRLLPPFLWRVATRFALSPEQGARTSIHVACAPELSQRHGEYFIRERPAAMAPAAQDSQAARKLWDESLRLAELAWPI